MTNLHMLKIKKTHPDALLPKINTEFSAGYDIYSLNGGVVPARGYLAVETGISVQLPDLVENNSNYIPCGIVKSRSGLSFKNNIEVGAGVIDYDYRGPIKVMLRNFSDEDFEFGPHSRIAQLIIMPVINTKVIEVQELTESVRGENGFGSSGLK